MQDVSKLFVFAYPPEAEPFLQHYSAQYLFQLKNIQFYYSENHNTYIIISGGGSINTSIALSVFFEKYPSLKQNILCFNIGIAGSYTLPLYEIFYASKITNYHYLKSFYPDIYIKTNYAPLMSIEFPANETIMKAYPDYMFDMESYAFASTLKYFVKNHQIHCIKFISDNNGIIQDMFELLNIYQSQLPQFLSVINNIAAEYSKYLDNKIVETLDNSAILTLIQNLNLTHSQQHQLKNAIQYAFHKLKNLETISDIISTFSFENIIHKHQKNQMFQQLLNALYNV